jgi:hypothetical protein
MVSVLTIVNYIVPARGYGSSLGGAMDSFVWTVKCLKLL